MESIKLTILNGDGSEIMPYESAVSGRPVGEVGHYYYRVSKEQKSSICAKINGVIFNFSHISTPSVSIVRNTQNDEDLAQQIYSYILQEIQLQEEGEA